MNKKLVLLGVLALSSFNVYADDAAQALAQKNGCLACHSVDKKVIGPSFKDVSAKYKGDATAEAKLVAKVKAGGSGVWGAMPMPANSPQVKDADIKTIVNWVLKQ